MNKFRTGANIRLKLEKMIINDVIETVETSEELATKFKAAISTGNQNEKMRKGSRRANIS